MDIKCLKIVRVVFMAMSKEKAPEQICAPPLQSANSREIPTHNSAKKQSPTFLLTTQQQNSRVSSEDVCWDKSKKHFHNHTLVSGKYFRTQTCPISSATNPKLCSAVLGSASCIWKKTIMTCEQESSDTSFTSHGRHSQNRVDGKLFERAQVGPDAPEAHEGLVKVVGEAGGAEHCRVIGTDDHWVVLGHQCRCRVVS